MTSKSNGIPPALLSIYRKTTFWTRDPAGQMVRFTARTAGRHPFLKHRRTAIITAWNPMLRPLSLTNNRLRGRRLEKEIRRGGWVHYPTSGHFKKHREEGFTIEGIPAAAARRLGRKFKQYAVVYIDKKGVQFLPCFNKRKKPAKTLRS